MNFVEAIASGFRNYVNFSGRAARSEFWFWVLFAFIVNIVAGILDVSIFLDGDEVTMGPISKIAAVVLFLPGLAVLFRRLHDIDRTGWWWLLGLTFIGFFVLIYWWCQPGTPGANRFGANPLPGGG